MVAIPWNIQVKYIHKHTNIGSNTLKYTRSNIYIHIPTLVAIPWNIQVCVYICVVYFRVLLPLLVCVCIYLTCTFQGIATNVGMCVYIFDLYISGYCYHCWYVCVYIWPVYFRVLLPLLVCVCIYLTCIKHTHNNNGSNTLKYTSQIYTHTYQHW
jgi:hypothetical protein